MEYMETLCSSTRAVRGKESPNCWIIEGEILMLCITHLNGLHPFNHVEDHESKGIYVIDRRHKGAEESVQELASVMYDFCGQSRRQRIILRNSNEGLSALLDWQNLGVFYRDCRRLALESLHPDVDKIMRENEGKVPSAATSRRPSIHSSDGEDEE
uniref:Glycogen [starch] synthase n=2 Tax=Caenorhabditis tropicalis TaxID=1561998 RepID=A0A1I7UFD2_9PELO